MRSPWVTWSGLVAGSVGWTYDSDFFPDSETAKGSQIKFGYDLDKLLSASLEKRGKLSEAG